MANIAATGQEFARKIINETCILDGIKFLIENCLLWHSDLLDSIYHLMESLIKLPLQLSSIEACFSIACIGVRTPYEPI